MVALRASRPAFLFPYTSQIHARSVARAPFQTVSTRSLQNATWAKFRLCEVALLDQRPRSARHGSGDWVAGCFETHVSILAPPSPGVTGSRGSRVTSNGPTAEILDRS